MSSGTRGMRKNISVQEFVVRKTAADQEPRFETGQIRPVEANDEPQSGQRLSRKWPREFDEHHRKISQKAVADFKNGQTKENTRAPAKTKIF